MTISSMIRSEVIPCSVNLSLHVGRHKRFKRQMLWLIVHHGRCVTVHTSEERALMTILFGYLQGAEAIPLA
jgi:hypothetical protein